MKITKKNNLDFWYLLDEMALITIIEDKSLQNQFIQIAQYAEVIICCRVAPLQKSQIIKNDEILFSPSIITLSVIMILE